MTINPLEMSRQFKAATNGQVIKLRPFDRIINIKTGPKSVVVLVETFGYVETTREVRFNTRTVRMTCYVPSFGSAPWQIARLPDGTPTEFETIDGEFEPFIENRFGKVENADERRDRVQFERDCYRTGGDVESFEVTFGYGNHSNVAMRKHWARQ